MSYYVRSFFDDMYDDWPCESYADALEYFNACIEHDLEEGVGNDPDRRHVIMKGKKEILSHTSISA